MFLQLNKDFTNLCKWFIDNKLHIYLGEDKTLCILFDSKHKLKNAHKLQAYLRYKTIFCHKVALDAQLINECTMN